MTTLSSYRVELQNYRGRCVRPASFEVFWSKVCTSNKPEADEVHAVPICCAGLDGKEFSCRASDGIRLTAHALSPAGDMPRPTVVLYTDLGRNVRGWLHLARFVSLGYTVVAPTLRTLPEDAKVHFRDAWQGKNDAIDLAAYFFGTSRSDSPDASYPSAEISPIERTRTAPLFQLISDAYAAAYAARSLSCVDKDRLMTWGEGFGGALALDVATLLGVECAGTMAQNPFFADVAGSLSNEIVSDMAPQNGRALEATGFLDTVSFAEGITCPTLVACSFMDQAAPLQGTYAAFNRIPATQKQIVTYPKHAHERINDFENLQIDFLLTCMGGKL